MNSKNELVEAYDYMLSEEKELAVLNEKIANENKDKEERKKLEYIEDEKRRTIEDLAGQHGVFFVHDIVDAEWKPSENNNAIDTTKLNFLDQLDIVNGFDPTISVSTLKKDTKQRTFGNGSWGVLLSGGRVIGGEQNDAGTKAYGLRDRRLFGGEDTKTIKGIESAIHGSDGNRTEGYNELVVEKPEIAGVYMKWDEMRPALQEGEDNFLVNENGVRYDRWWEKMNDTLKRNMPLFVIDPKNNSVRMLYEINVAKRSFKVTPEFKPSQMTTLPGIYKQHLGDTEKRQSGMRVIDKVTGLLPEEEMEKYTPDGTETDSRGMYSVH